MEKLKITHLPKGALSVMKDVITEEGDVLSVDGAVRGIASYLIFCEEPLALREISEFLCEDNIIAERVFIKTLKLLSKDGAFSYRNRRKIIEKNLFECLRLTDRLNFEGFINFRLGEYLNLLCRAVTCSALDYFY